VNIDLGLLNHTTLISVYPYWLDTIGLVNLGLLQALVIVPMLVQSYLDAFLATVVEVKDSLHASPRVLFRCYFSSRPTSRSSLALVPLVVRSAPPMLEDFPSRHAAALPLDSLESDSYIYILRRPRVESLPFVLLHFCIIIPLYDCYYVSCRLCIVG